MEIVVFFKIKGILMTFLKEEIVYYLTTFY